MNAIKNTNSHSLAAVNGPASGTAARYVMTVGETACEVRGRMVAEIAEVLPKYLHLKRRIRETAAAALACLPAAMITIATPR